MLEMCSVRKSFHWIQRSEASSCDAILPSMPRCLSDSMAGVTPRPRSEAHRELFAATAKAQSWFSTSTFDTAKRTTARAYLMGSLALVL